MNWVGVGVTSGGSVVVYAVSTFRHAPITLILVPLFFSNFSDPDELSHDPYYLVDSCVVFPHLFEPVSAISGVAYASESVCDAPCLCWLTADSGI